MRVGVLVHGGLDDEDHGVHVPFLRGLIHGLAERCELEVITVRHDAAAPEVEELPQGRITRVRDGWRRDPFLRSAALFHAAARLHTARPVHLWHGIWALPGGMLSALLGRMTGVPSVVSLHGAESACLPRLHYGDLADPVRRRVVRLACTSARRVVLLSETQRDPLRLAGVFGADAGEGRIAVIPPGVDLTRFQYIPDRPVHEELRILHVANLTPVKDQETLLRAFIRIRAAHRARLRIVGADSMDGWVQRRAEALGVAGDVDFIGYVPHRDMAAQYAWAHVLLQSSLHEASGVAVAEAAAAGVAIVSTAVGTAADFSPEAASVVPCGDADGLAAAVLALAGDTDRRLRQLESARARIERHSLTACAEALFDVYSAAAARPSGVVPWNAETAEPAVRVDGAASNSVSVIIPTYERPDSLRRALVSLAAQDEPADEVVVVAAGDAPSLDDLTRAYPLPGLRLLTVAQPSVCVQRNLGIREAHGEWIVLCDDDIEFPPGALGAMRTHAEKHPDAAAVTGVVVEDGVWPDAPGVAPPTWMRMLWQWVFLRSIWCDVDRIRVPGWVWPLVEPVRGWYRRRGNTRTPAGWPLVATVGHPAFATRYYGLGAALLRRSALPADPFPGMLDPDGIGDNYAVASLLPGPAPIHVLTELRIVHHRSELHRRDPDDAAARRTLALHCFLEQEAGFRASTRVWLLWSVAGDVLESLLRGRVRRAVLALNAMRCIMTGRNPFLLRASGKPSTGPPVL